MSRLRMQNTYWSVQKPDLTLGIRVPYIAGFLRRHDPP